MTEIPITSINWLCARDGAVLAVRSRGSDAFYLPGGKPEAGETAEQALVREVREELGIDLSPSSLTAAFTLEDVAHGQGGRALRMQCFTAPLIGTPRAAAEIEELRWIPPEAFHLLAPAARAAAERHTRGEPEGAMRPGIIDA